MNPQQMYEACTDALGAFVRSAGFTDVVIGLSGGMDSTLVAVMAADALEDDHVHGVMLPGPYSSESSIDDAEALALLVGHSLTVDDALTLRGLAELYHINQKPRRV